MACLTDDMVTAFVQGQLDGPARAQVERHLQDCADCCTLVAECAKWMLRDSERGAQTGASPLPAPDLPLAPGTGLGRYRIVHPLGSGGGGAVYEAHDPQLQRRVAIKVLHPTGPEARSAVEQARLLGEAQATARLSHPNVVAIHDAGLADGRIFLVLELVQGPTLAAWLREEPRGWREIVARFRDAARGLAAAHRTGIVHGDFKPENVLVDGEGRARVADFGLASQNLPPQDDDGKALIGTPRYMAPEQLRGSRATDRSDQYSLALSLRSALEQAGGRVPRSLLDSLERAAAPDPEARFPSLEDFITALEQASQTRRRWPWVMAAGAAGTMALIATVSIRVGERPRPAFVCGDGVLQPGESCDDGNRNDLDGCSSACVRCGPESFFWPNNGRCYGRQATARSWLEAGRACLQTGGTLVDYVHRTEREAVRGAFASTGPYWIGLHRQHQERGFVWSSGAATDPSLGAFPAGDATGQQGCVSEGRDRWGTTSCGDALPFVCERGPWRLRAETGHAYQSFTVPVSWDEARAACERSGAHLVTIQDEDEQAFVASMVSLYSWIGATDQGDEGRFVWVTGDKVAFRSFAADQPNDEAGRQNCLAMGADGRWHDWDCAGGYPFICEIDAR